MHTYMHTYIRIYIHTYTHIYIVVELDGSEWEFATVPVLHGLTILRKKHRTHTSEYFYDPSASWFITTMPLVPMLKKPKSVR
jgi:hypothetical protein